jgi:hypothetical protein
MASPGWRIGWTAGAGVVATAAALLIELNLRARRIAAQADDIATSLESAGAHTAPLFEIASTNLALDRATRALQQR